MHGAQVLIPIDADAFWQQLRNIVGEVIDQKNSNQGFHSVDPAPRLLKVKDVCKLFQISKPTLYEWIRKGQLRSVKIESRRFFRPGDIEELIAKQADVRIVQ